MNVLTSTAETPLTGNARERLDPLLAALATCASLYILVSCRVRGVPTDGLTLEQQWLGNEARVRLRVTVDSSFSDALVTAVRGAARSWRVQEIALETVDIVVVVAAESARG